MKFCSSSVRLLYQTADVVLNDAQQKAIECVEDDVVAVVDRCLVLERATSVLHHGPGDRRIHPGRRPGSGGVRAAGVERAAEVEAAEKMVDALLLDELDVVGQRP